MQPVLFDILAAAIVIFFAVYGWRYGFVRTVGSVIGLVVSIILGTWALSWAQGAFGLSFSAHPILIIILFVVATLVASALMGWVVTLLDFLRKILSILPFVSLINRMLGLAVGIVEGAGAILALVYLVQLLLTTSSVYATIAASQTFPYAVAALKIVHIL